MRFTYELLDPFVRFFQFFPKVTATEWPSTRSNADCDPDISDLHCIFRALANLHRREQCLTWLYMLPPPSVLGLQPMIISNWITNIIDRLSDPCFTIDKMHLQSSHVARARFF